MTFSSSALTPSSLYFVIKSSILFPSQERITSSNFSAGIVTCFNEASKT
nr:MAG TPA: hypothetical protein [Caudoviricetes sp.]